VVDNGCDINWKAGRLGRKGQVSSPDAFKASTSQKDYESRDINESGSDFPLHIPISGQIDWVMTCSNQRGSKGISPALWRYSCDLAYICLDLP